jgi:type VII secretion integral membrane protein EccD
MTDVLPADEPRLISPAPDRVRISFLCTDIQVDVSLPLDVPMIGLMPQLVQLAKAREVGQADASDDLSTVEAKNDIWVLARRDGTSPLPPQLTLREAQVAEGELLSLTAERALSAPTLYDDVVDAAARLNKAGYPGWDANAARWMAFTAVYLTSGVWVYFLTAKALAHNRTALATLSAAVVLALAGAAALAYRRHGQRDTGAALGWAALPIAAADAWLTLHGLGGYGAAGACGAMLIVSETLWRFVGTGHWGYRAVQVMSGCTGLALLAHAAGVRADFAGAALALLATLGCLAVPALTGRFVRVKPSDTESVWARVESETLTRSALYTGLAVSGGLGVFAVLTSKGPVHWSGLAFALGCALALGCYTQRPATAVERAGLAIPAAALVVLSCALAQGGSPPMPIVAFGTLLTTAVAFALTGVGARPGRSPHWLTTGLAYLSYLITAALTPLALWAVDAYTPGVFA